jgi:hypothetical protein
MIIVVKPPVKLNTMIIVDSPIVTWAYTICGFSTAHSMLSIQSRLGSWPLTMHPGTWLLPAATNTATDHPSTLAARQRFHTPFLIVPQRLFSICAFAFPSILPLILHASHIDLEEIVYIMLIIRLQYI